MAKVVAKRENAKKEGKKAEKSNGDAGVMSGRTWILFSVAVAISSYLIFRYWEVSRLYTPLGVPTAVSYFKDGKEQMERLWGTYRYNHLS